MTLQTDRSCQGPFFSTYPKGLRPGMDNLLFNLQAYFVIQLTVHYCCLLLQIYIQNLYKSFKLNVLVLTPHLLIPGEENQAHMDPAAINVIVGLNLVGTDFKGLLELTSLQHRYTAIRVRFVKLEEQLGLKKGGNLYLDSPR